MPQSWKKDLPLLSARGSGFAVVSPDGTGGTLPPLPTEPLTVEGMPGVEESHIQSAFDDIDFDHNGFIGVNELRYLLVVSGERPTDAELDEMIRMLDNDGDGQISFGDFLTMFLPGSAVLREMLTHKPDPERGRRAKQQTATKSETTDTSEQSRMQRAISDLPDKFSGSMKQVDLMLKTGWGFQHALQEKTRRERLSHTLPESREAARGANRSRPHKTKDPLPLSPRQARANRIKRERAEASGSTKGLPRSNTAK